MDFDCAFWHNVPSGDTWHAGPAINWVDLMIKIHSFNLYSIDYRANPEIKVPVKLCQAKSSTTTQYSNTIDHLIVH